MYSYSHGGNAAFESGQSIITDLSANINPFGVPINVESAIIGDIPQIVSYPDNSSRKLREKIAEFENVHPDRIFCGNGASDIIFRLPRAVQAKKVMLTAPTFSDYERAALSYGAELLYYALDPDEGFILDYGFVETAIAENPDLIFICNPNNPTGTLTDPALIKKLLDHCKNSNAMVAVDECFLDFTEKADDYTSKIYLDEYKNLIIFKAFTKLFTMPGVRLGYSLCSDEMVINNLYFHGPDWAVSNLAQAAGIAALDGADQFVRQTVDYVSAERNKMEKELLRLGYRVFKTSANYVFLQSPYSFDLQEELNKEGIRIRSCSNYHELDNSYFRIAVSTSEKNTKLLSAVEKVTMMHTNGN